MVNVSSQDPRLIPQKTLLPNRPYRLMTDLAAVASINIAHHVLAIHPSIPAQTLPEGAARALKDMSPIPADALDNDSYWP